MCKTDPLKKKTDPPTCLSLRMNSVSKSQKKVATTQVQVSVGISRNEASDAPTQNKSL